MSFSVRKILFSLLIGGVVSILLLFLASDTIFAHLVKKTISDYTGFETKVHGVTHQYPAVFHLEGVKLMNPEGFRNKVFVEMPRVQVDLDLSGFLSGRRVRFRKIYINIQDINLERNSTGVSNVLLLQHIKNKLTAATHKDSELNFKVNDLQIVVRRVHYWDATSEAPKRFTTNLGTKKDVYQNLMDHHSVIDLILARVFYGTTFGELAGLRRDFFEKPLKGLLNRGSSPIETARLNKKEAQIWRSETKSYTRDRFNQVFGEKNT